MGARKYGVIKNGDTLLIGVVGALDEDSVFPTLELSGIKIVELDFENMAMINSCGIRDWIAWLREIPEKIQLIYKSCPVNLIDQINMVEGLVRTGSEIRSFYVPYYCEACDFISNHIVTSAGSWKNFRPAELGKCQKCGQNVEIDVIESKYFKFLKRF